VVSATRRAFLRAAGVSGVGGSAVLLTACGGKSKPATGPTLTAAASNPNTDVDVLNAALDLENTAIAIYTAASKRLTGDALRVGKAFLNHEMAHADGITRAIQQVGGTPNQPKNDYSAALGHPKSQADVLRLAEAFENTVVAAYLDAIPKLTEPKLRQTLASILTDEAEHISVLRTALGLSPVPTAFVRGKA
jgi:bacterioferritin (cytochrome b1)